MRRLVLVGATTWSLLSCAERPAAARPPNPEARGEEMVARMESTTITRGELEARIVGELAALRQDEYALYRRALDELVAEQLIGREAGRRGISREELFRVEVTEKTRRPTDAEIGAFYELNRSRFGGQAKAQAAPQIEQVLRQQAAGSRAAAFQRELAKQAGLQILLAPPRSEVPLPATAPALGPLDARVTIVEFTDYQCPFCLRAQSTVDEILKRYSGKVRLVYRDLPLDFHTRAFAASRAARCAGDQDRFWEYHRDLLTTAGDYTDDGLKRRAASLGLDPAGFASCLASSKHDATIRDSVRDASRLGVKATPTFFINGRLLSGARPFADFEEVIEEELADAGS